MIISGNAPTVTWFRKLPLRSKKTTFPGSVFGLASTAAAIPLLRTTTLFTPPPYTAMFIVVNTDNDAGLLALRPTMLFWALLNQMRSFTGSKSAISAAATSYCPVA